ncbi:MAG: tetratricopeptide repeat protein [Crocosphaera sp.]|nr:tetratricopeptide repeat protein [Crocosphaera sp.]
MNFLSPSSSEYPHFNLLSIGRRGVGKTVFLAGSYAEMNQVSQEQDHQKIWFDCENGDDKKTLDSILDYVKRTGSYPPPTLKMTNFDFILKQKNHNKVKTLCDFSWSDIPGEYCDFTHPDFQDLVLSSHSCCVFINGEKLVKDPTYIEELEGLVKQVMAIAILVDEKAIDYGFALIITQCDRLPSGSMTRLQIEENLQFLTTRLEAANAKYQRFYSGIPIVSKNDEYYFEVNGSAAAFLWIVSELQKDSFLSRHHQSLDNSLKLDVSSLQYWLSPSPKIVWPLVGIVGTLFGLAGISLFVLNGLSDNKYDNQMVQESIQELETTIENNPNDTQSALTLVNYYLNQEQSQQAIDLLKKIIQQKPNNLENKIQLAQLYERMGETQAAESIYDGILTQNSTYFDALFNKALIRHKQGDSTAAKDLLQKAQENASSEPLKVKTQAAIKQLDLE